MRLGRITELLNLQASDGMSRAKRVSVLLVAAMQLVLPPALTVADGFIEAAAPESAVVSHIEAHGGPKCARVHNEETCAICHFLSRANANKPSAGQCLLAASRVISAPLPIAGFIPRAASRNLTFPRAPPIA
jgi:hypothetical protein